MYYGFYAFLGSGSCDPGRYKTLFVTSLAIVVMWLVITFIVKKLRLSKLSALSKNLLVTLVLIIASIITIAAAFGLWIGSLCN